jgi:hypothetical protein
MTRFLSLHRVGLLAASLLVAFAPALHAQTIDFARALHAQTITTFDMPNSTFTQPSAINAAGQITGSYLDAFGPHNFLRQSDGTLISFDVPVPPGFLPKATGATSINADGQITGYIYSLQLFLYFGFLRQTDGTFVLFLSKGCINGPPLKDGLTPRAQSIGLDPVEGTAPTGINNRGQITGVCGPGASINYGFLRQPDGATISFSAKADVLNPSTRALAINSHGQITGVYLQRNPTFIYRGFLRERNGTITTFDVNGLDTIPTALNSQGQITGYAGNDGFLRQPDGSIVIFDGPNSTSTQSTAINPKGQITGVYLDASTIYHGFLRDKDGSIATVDVPNASNTYLTGINPRGDITGWYSDASGVHGFVRSR